MMDTYINVLLVKFGKKVTEVVGDFDTMYHREVVAWYRDNPGPAHIFPSKERFYSDDWIESLDKDDEVDTESIM